MSIYSREQIDELKSKINYFEFYQRYMPDLVQKGRLAWACCPFHNETKPSFSVDVEYGLARCWGACNEGFDVFSFYQKLYSVSFNEAVEQIAEMYGYELIVSEEERRQREYKKKLYEINKTMCSKFEISLRQNLNAWNYLTVERKFSENIIEQFRLGLGINKLPEKESLKTLGLQLVNKEGVSYPKFTTDRITIPRFDENGNILSFTGRLCVDKKFSKYMHTTDTEIYKKSKLIFGLYQAKKYIKALKSVICVEGELDCIKCHQKGIVNTVAISGLNVSESQINLLKKYTNTFYICVEDGAILEANDKKITSLDKFYNAVKESIPYAKVYIVDLRKPDGSKCDPDMFLNEHTKEEFKQKIQQAKIYNEFLIGEKLKTVNPKNIEEKTACLNMVVPVLANISNFMDRKQYIELVANKLLISENDVYRKIKYHNENKESKALKDLTWDSRPVYAQKILLSMCFCKNFNTYKVIGLIQNYVLDKMEAFYKNIFNDYILDYVKKWYDNNGEKPVDFTQFFSNLNYNEDVNELVKKTILDIYFKIENLDEFDDEDVYELINEQRETLDDYIISEHKPSSVEDELALLDI